MLIAKENEDGNFVFEETKNGPKISDVHSNILTGKNPVAQKHHLPKHLRPIQPEHQMVPKKTVETRPTRPEFFPGQRIPIQKKVPKTTSPPQTETFNVKFAISEYVSLHF